MKRRILTLIVTLLSFFGTASSQQIAIGEMVVDHLQLEASADSAWVALRLELSDLHLKSNQEIELCPTLVVDGEPHSLSTVKIMGRRRYLYDQRNRTAGGQARHSQRVRRVKGEAQQLNYFASVPLERMPTTLQLRVNASWGSCRCESYDRQQWTLGEREYIVTHYRPYLPYLTPALDAEKGRVEKGSAYIEFKVGSVEILPEFRQNAIELARVGERICKITADEDVLLKRILITGYASPEGSFESNQQLAQGRTQALIDFLLQHYEIDSDKVVVGFGDEDWKVLRNYILESPMAEKAEVLEVIDGEGSWDDKEQILRRNHPAVYMDLGKICFPKLRRTDYEIDYRLRSFTPEEASQLIFQTPQKLSLSEMYAAAQVFPQGSEPFCEALEIAVKMYPSSEVANLNAALAALEKRELKTAEKYLKKSGNGGEALMARGILAYLRHDITTAKKWLHQALEQGTEGAEENLKMIEYDTNHQ